MRAVSLLLPPDHCCCLVCRRCRPTFTASHVITRPPSRLCSLSPQDAWRGRQSAATTLAHMDSFFKTVLTSSMGNDLQVGGAEWVGWQGLKLQLFQAPLVQKLSSSCMPPAALLLVPTYSPSFLTPQNKDLALPQHSDRAHKLLADNDTTVHMSYDVSGFREGPAAMQRRVEGLHEPGDCSQTEQAQAGQGAGKPLRRACWRTLIKLCPLVRSLQVY